MAIEFLLLLFGIALGILTAVIPYEIPVSHQERIRFGAKKP